MTVPYGNKAKKEGWPEGSRRCLMCNDIKPFKEFHALKHSYGGVNTVCKLCRKPISKKDYKSKSIEYNLWYAARARARKRGLDFNIEETDIIVPESCPILGFKLSRYSDKAPSLDRIDNKEGYVKGNVEVLSVRANRLKGDYTVEEFEMMIKYLRGSCEL